MQEESDQRPYKVSFYIEKDAAEEVMPVLSQCLKNRGVRIKHIEVKFLKSINNGFVNEH